jgi:hypothetical protein
MRYHCGDCGGLCMLETTCVIKFIDAGYKVESVYAKT